jgi:hypothetical protein
MKEVGRNKEGSHVFFSLITAVMIVLSNVAFEQYAFYKMESERIDRLIESIDGEYSKTLMLESIVEVKNSLMSLQLMMLSEMKLLDSVNYLLAGEFNMTKGIERPEVAQVIKENLRLSSLLEEVANVSSYVSITGPDLQEYGVEVSRQIAELSAGKGMSEFKGIVVWRVGLLLIINVLVLTLYSLYLSQVKDSTGNGEKYVSRMKVISTLQVVFGVAGIFGMFANLIGPLASNAVLIAMNVLLFASIGFSSLHTAKYLVFWRKRR